MIFYGIVVHSVPEADGIRKIWTEYLNQVEKTLGVQDLMVHISSKTLTPLLNTDEYDLSLTRKNDSM